MSSKLFDHLHAIYTDQRLDYFDALEDIDKKTFEPYMVNRFISMNPHYSPVANEMNKYYGVIDKRSSYLFYSQLLPKGKQFNKYIKAEKRTDFPEWMKSAVMRMYDVDTRTANYYITLYLISADGKNALRKLCEDNAVESKLLKKEGL